MIRVIDLRRDLDGFAALFGNLHERVSPIAERKIQIVVITDQTADILFIGCAVNFRLFASAFG